MISPMIGGFSRTSYIIHTAGRDFIGPIRPNVDVSVTFRLRKIIPYQVEAWVRFDADEMGQK